MNPREFSYGEVWEALERLTRLQAHYAELLNMHDGGKRKSFKGATEYLLRLRQLEGKGVK